MHALVVVAHPDPKSLTHAVAARLAEGVVGHSVEIADLMAEGFDPRFTANDHAVHLKQAAPSADVRPSRRGSTAPMRWCWSIRSIGGRCRGCSRAGSTGSSPMAGPMTRSPAAGWRRSWAACRSISSALGGAGRRTYERHGYSGAMKTQIDHGIFDYCGARVVTSELLLPSDTQDPGAHLDTARAIGGRLFQAAERRSTPPDYARRRGRATLALSDQLANGRDNGRFRREASGRNHVAGFRRPGRTAQRRLGRLLVHVVSSGGRGAHEAPGAEPVGEGAPGPRRPCPCRPGL